MGIDTQLHVKSRNQDAARVELLQRKLVLLEHSGAVGNEAQQVRAELDKMEEDRAAHSDEYPIFQLIPKEMMINKGKNMKLLPNDMGQWHTKVPQDNPAQALVLAKQVTVLVYDGARKLCGGLSPVLVPPRILIEDPEVRAKVMWQDIQLVEPWGDEEVSDDIFSFNPTFLPRDRLSSTQQAVCDEMQKTLEMCEFVYYWSREGWCLELLEELRGGFS
ncbi:TPA: hypothetical protein ACH3X1_006641 [Trebouxia sp. C0004]